MLPGVPDVYQGTELVDRSLVDPDNRRPVDYDDRRARLAHLDGGGAPRDLDDEKLLVTSRALRLRARGARAPSPARTPATSRWPRRPGNALALARGPVGEPEVVLVVTRRPGELDRLGGWGRHTVSLPEGRWEDVLSGPPGSPRGPRGRQHRRRGPARRPPRRPAPARPVTRVPGASGPVLHGVAPVRGPLAGSRPMSHTFAVWAPEATTVDLVLVREATGPDDGQRTSRPMTGTDGGWWHLAVGGTGHGSDYLFSVDGGDPVPDPRSAWQPFGVHGPSRLFDPSVHAWGDDGWRGKDVRGAVHYELHVGTFTPEGTLDAAAARLDHLVAPGRRGRRPHARGGVPRPVGLGLRRRPPVRRPRPVRRSGRPAALRRRLPRPRPRRVARRRLQPPRPGRQLHLGVRAVLHRRARDAVGPGGQPRRRALPRGPPLDLRQRAALVPRLPRRRAAPGRRPRARRRLAPPRPRPAGRGDRGPVRRAAPAAVARGGVRPQRRRHGHPDRRGRPGHDGAVGRRRAPRPAHPADRGAAGLLRRLRQRRGAADGVARGVLARRAGVDLPRRRRLGRARAARDLRAPLPRLRRQPRPDRQPRRRRPAGRVAVRRRGRRGAGARAHLPVHAHAVHGRGVGGAQPVPVLHRPRGPGAGRRGQRRAAGGSSPRTAGTPTWCPTRRTRPPARRPCCAGTSPPSRSTPGLLAWTRDLLALRRRERDLRDDDLGTVEVEAGPPDEHRADGRPEWLVVHRGAWRVVVVLRDGETEVPLQGHGTIERHWGPAWTTGRTVRLQGPGAALVRLHD